MPLDPTSADALAASICSALGIADAASQAKMQTQWRTIYAALKTDITITINALAIMTNGGPTTQQGPPAPIPINPD